jgi:hypothetical protein
LERQLSSRVVRLELRLPHWNVSLLGRIKLNASCELQAARNSRQPSISGIHIHINIIVIIITLQVPPRFPLVRPSSPSGRKTTHYNGTMII